MTQKLRGLVPYLKYPCLLVGAGFVLLGTFRAEHLVVLKKAVKICLECIGIG